MEITMKRRAEIVREMKKNGVPAPDKYYQGKYAVFVAELPATYTKIVLNLCNSPPGSRSMVGGHFGLLIATHLGYYQAVALQRCIDAARKVQTYSY